MLTDDVTSSGVSPRDGSTMTKTSVGKPVQVTSAPLQPRASTEREGYFSETEAQRVIRQEVLSRKMYSSTGDLWRGPSTLENEPPVVTMVGSRGRHRRIYRPRSLSMNHVDGIHHYGTTLLASGRLDRDFGFYGDSEKPATFRRRVPVPVIANSCSSPVGSWTGSWTADGRRGLYRKRSEVAPSRYHTIHHVTKTIPDELPNGLRTAAIIKLRDVKPVTYSATLLGSRPDDVIVNFAPVQRSNSCSYDVSQGRTSPTLSIPLGDSRDINISTLPRSGGTRWRFITDADDDEVFYSGRRQGAVLSPGVPLVEPEKDLELLHIEVQGAEKEWTLKREKAAKSPSQYSSGTDASVQTDREQQEVSRTRHYQHQARESRARTRQVDENRVVTNSRHKAQERKGKPRQFYEVQDFELNGTRQERREPKGKARESYDYVDYDVNSSRRESRVDGSGGWGDGGRSRGKRAVHREYNDDRRRRAEDELDGATEHEHVTYTESRHGVLADRHLQSAGQLDSHQPELFYDIDLVGRHHVTSGHRRADFGAVGDQRIEVKRTEIGSHTTAGTRRVPLVDPTVDKRSHLLGSTSVDVHAFSTLPVAKSPGVATSHISRRFQYQPVQHRYRNRNHYYSSQGWNLITTGVGYEDVDGECQLDSVRSPGLEKFPDFVYDRSRLRDVRISYTDDSTSDADGSTPTLTPARNSIAGDDAAENDANGYDDRFETGSHVQVINVGEDDVGGERLVTTETQQTSEIVVFTDSSGAVYDTALTSMLERSRNEAMQELDRMTESSWTADAKDDVIGETAAGRVVTKQDDNNNITGFVGGQAGDGGADRESDSASSISSSTSGEGAGSYHVSGAVSSSRQLAGDGERTERGKTYTSSTANVISTNPEAASNGAGLHPGEVTLKSTENVKDVSREIRKAVVRANSVGSPDQQPDFRNELQAVLRLRSVSMEEEGEERAKEPEVGTSARQSVSDAVQADTENRCNRDDVIADGVEPEVEREASYVAVTESTETTAVSVERDQMMTSSSSSSSSSCEIRTSSMTELISGVDVKAPAHDPAKDRVVEALVRTGSVSSLRQVYKTPPSSLRQKRPTLSVAKSSDIFANSANDVGRAKPTASGKFVMRFREGDGGAGSADEKRAPPRDYTRSPASVRSQASAGRIEVNQDMSLPANEEVQFAEGGGYPDSERYSIQQSDDTLSQSSYSSSKLEHFNFGLSNFQSNF